MFLHCQKRVNLLNNNQFISLEIAGRKANHSMTPVSTIKRDGSFSKQLSERDVLSAIRRHFINPRSCDCVLALSVLLMAEHPNIRRTEFRAAVEVITDVVNKLNVQAAN